MMTATGLTREKIEACIDRGVIERPPVPGQSHAGFVVLLAIGHRHGERFILDLVRDWLTIQQAADLLKAGADDEGDDSVSLAHAVCGVISVLKEAAP
jgi:hypothetical protein